LLIDEPRQLLAAVARVVARRLAPEALVENGIGIVRLHAVAIGADVKLAARLQREPLGRLHLPERRVDADALQLTDHEGRQIGERRQSAREHLDLEGTRRPEPGGAQERARLGLLVVGPAVAGERAEIALDEPPEAVRPREHPGAEHGAALIDGLDDAAAIDGPIHRLAHLHVVEGWLARVDHQQVDHAGVHGRADELRRPLLELLGDGLGRLAGKRHVHPPGLERRHRSAALGDDQIAQPVEIRPSLHEVARVLDVLDELALAPLLDLERPGADAAGAVARRRHVSGVDRREAGGEHEQERRLRALETDDHRARIDRLDAVDVDVPLVPGIGPQLRRRIGRLPQHVERVLDVRGAERPAVVPGDVAPQREHQLAVVLLPRPALGQLADDRVGAVRGLGRIEEHQVAEARHGRPHRGDGRALVDRETLRQVLAQAQRQHAARLRRLTDGRRFPERDERDRHDGDDPSHGMAAYLILVGWPVDMAGESPVPYLPTMATTVSVARTALEALLQDAPAKETPYADFLDLVLTEEVASKTAKHVTMRTRLARFPFVTSLETFDFSSLR